MRGATTLRDYEQAKRDEERKKLKPRPPEWQRDWPQLVLSEKWKVYLLKTRMGGTRDAMLNRMRVARDRPNRYSKP